MPRLKQPRFGRSRSTVPARQEFTDRVAPAESAKLDRPSHSSVTDYTPTSDSTPATASATSNSALNARLTPPHSVKPSAPQRSFGIHSPANPATSPMRKMKL